MITWPEGFWMCYFKEFTTKGTLTQERLKCAIWFLIAIGSFIHIEATKRIMDNSYFIAPKAFGFLFMALCVRGAFNRYPLNIIQLKYIFPIVKAIAVGLIATGCGIDGSPRVFKGMF